MRLRAKLLTPILAAPGYPAIASPNRDDRVHGLGQELSLDALCQSCEAYRGGAFCLPHDGRSRESNNLSQTHSGRAAHPA